MHNYADESLPGGDAGNDARRHPDRVDLFAWQVADDAAIEVDGEATWIDPEPVVESVTLPARIPDRQDDVIVAALPARRVQVYPGEVAELDVVLVNNGRQPATFLVHVEGWFDESWLAPPPPITLQAGERCTVMLAIAPPRRPETEAGEYAIVVVVRSHDYPSRTARLGAQLLILPYDEITVEVLPAAQSALSVAPESERADIDGRMVAVLQVMGTEDASLIEATTKLLAQGTEAFAALRMNRGIQQALAGKNIETV